MVFDSQGRLYVASDASGEIYVIAKQESSNGTGSSGSGGGKGGGDGNGALGQKAPVVAFFLLLVGWLVVGMT